MKHILTLILVLIALQAVAGPGHDDDLTPYQKLMRKAPLLAQAIRSVDHICDRVVNISLNNAPGIDYYLVTCDNAELGQTRYTVGVTRTRTVVWPGEMN